MMIKNMMKLFLLMSLATVLATRASAQASVISSSLTPYDVYTDYHNWGYMVYTPWLGALGTCTDNTRVGLSTREWIACPNGVKTNGYTYLQGTSGIAETDTEYACSPQSCSTTGNLYVSWAYVNYCDDSTIYGDYTPGTC